MLNDFALHYQAINNESYCRTLKAFRLNAVYLCLFCQGQWKCHQTRKQWNWYIRRSATVDSITIQSLEHSQFCGITYQRQRAMRTQSSLPVCPIQHVLRSCNDNYDVRYDDMTGWSRRLILAIEQYWMTRKWNVKRWSCRITIRYTYVNVAT